MANQGKLDNDKLFSVAPVKQHFIKEDALQKMVYLKIQIIVSRVY